MCYNPIVVKPRPVGQAAKTSPSHGENGSSILPRVTKNAFADCKCVFSCFYPRLTRADTLSGGKKLTLDIVIVLGGRVGTPSSSSSPAPIFTRRKVLRSFSGAENVPDEADEAGVHQPANEENEVRRGFSPEKPCLPLSTEGTRIKSTSPRAGHGDLRFLLSTAAL